ncbi:MAG TPA: hypothetical protein PKE16_03140 [Hyphomicrobium sp.]|nr:hypothetical protein [Hyphomicrobium sp.]
MPLSLGYPAGLCSGGGVSDRKWRWTIIGLTAFELPIRLWGIAKAPRP